jgi:hypothetical protein
MAFACVAVLLVGVVAACGAPTAGPANPDLAPAQATNVRRTEVADVQRIVANNPTATSTVAPTVAAPPTCRAQGAIWWYEARTHIGESRTIQGTILATRPAPDGLALLEVGQRYPDPTGLGLLVPATQGSTLAGKNVCVTGRITTVEGRPTILLQDPSSIVVLN